MNRELFDKLVYDTYGIEADFPWADSSEAVYRHTSNKKWFAIVLNVSKSKLFPKENNSTDEQNDFEQSCFKNQIKKKADKNNSQDEKIDIVNLKCPQDVFETIWLEPNIFPAYHMNKRHWISVPLDGSVSDKTISFLLSKSFNATAFKAKKRKSDFID